MKKLLGIFDTKKYTPEQIYESIIKTINEKDRLKLIQLAKKRGEQKKRQI